MTAPPCMPRVYVIRLMAVDERAGLHALRRLLKRLLRDCGLRCIGIREETP
jgi:hypothetical protein